MNLVVLVRQHIDILMYRNNLKSLNHPKPGVLESNKLFP